MKCLEINNAWDLSELLKVLLVEHVENINVSLDDSIPEVTMYFNNGKIFNISIKQIK